MPEESAKRLAIIALHGTMDMAYPPFILATAAAAMDMEVAIFFTFYGLELLKKGKIDKLKVAPIANPAMPVPMPNIIGMLPGMTAMATMMMNKWMKKAAVSKLSELLESFQRIGSEAHRLPDDHGRHGRQERRPDRRAGVRRRRNLPGVRQPQRDHVDLLSSGLKRKRGYP